MNDHIKEPYSLAEIKAKIASHEYSAELLLQHAMLLLDASPFAPAQQAEPAEKLDRLLWEAIDYAASHPNDARKVDPRTWEHLLVYSTLPAPSLTVGDEAGPFELDPLEKIIDAYLDDYILDDGDEVSHKPTEFEQFLIKDAIMGLLVDKDWDEHWGRLIAEQAAALAPAAQAEPVAADQVRRLAEDWADDCIKAGYVTTINSPSWHKMAAAITGLASNPPAQGTGELPKPFGYVSDGFPDGLHFQHEPWPEMHTLFHSTAPVYSHAQMRAALAQQKEQA